MRSGEINRLRSQLLPKTSVYLSFYFRYRFRPRSPTHWLTFRPGETETTDYMPLEDVPIHSSPVSVGSEIYFIGRCNDNLWILDTRSRNLRTAPGMNVSRSMREAAVGVVDGKIYVIGGSEEESQVEVFDPQTQTWEFAGEEKVQCKSRFSASLEQKVYIVGSDHVSAYCPSEGIISNEAAMENLSAKCLCVVENVIYACKGSELMWFNTKLKVWRRVVDRDGKDGKLEMYSSVAEKMVEYEGKLAFLWPLRSNIGPMKDDIVCKLIALDRVGDEVRGTVEWSGIVATLPLPITLEDSLVVSD